MGQTVALWIAAVSLAILAAFTMLNYLDNDDAAVHREAEIVQWTEMKYIACAQSFAAFTGLSVEALELLSGTVENVLEICNNIGLP